MIFYSPCGNKECKGHFSFLGPLTLEHIRWETSSTLIENHRMTMSFGSLSLTHTHTLITFLFCSLIHTTNIILSLSLSLSLRHTHACIILKHCLCKAEWLKLRWRGVAIICQGFLAHNKSFLLLLGVIRSCKKKNSAPLVIKMQDYKHLESSSLKTC